MKRELKIGAVAVLAGAATLACSRMAKAAITVVGTDVGSVTLNGATWDAIDFNLTSLSGVDANGGLSGQDPGVDELTGTFTATGTSAYLSSPGAASGTYAFTKYDYIAGLQLTAPTKTNARYGGSGSNNNFGSSYVNMDGTPAGVTRTGALNGAGSSTSIAGTATSLSGTWSTTDMPVEPSNSTYNPNPLLAEILVPAGDGVAFTGQYDSSGTPTLATYNFAYSPSSGPTNKTISLVATTPTTYGSSLGSVAVSPNGKVTSANFAATATGYVSVTNGPSPYYALKILVGGQTASSSAIAAIVADINNNESGVGTASALSTDGFASAFPGYDILVPDSLSNASPYFAFDFSSTGDADSTYAVTVTSVAAVPEPATMAGVILGAAGLLLGRRKNRTLVA
jgi:hypothetical protein